MPGLTRTWNHYCPYATEGQHLTIITNKLMFFGNNCQQSVTNVAKMMFDSAKRKRDDAMKYFEKIEDR